MYVLLMVLFITLCIFLAIFVLIQQGKGDLGLGSMGGNQMLFGGSGGQNFFERATWTMGALFILGALGLTIIRSKEERSSVLEGVAVARKQPAQSVPVAQVETPSEETQEEQA